MHKAFYTVVSFVLLLCASDAVYGQQQTAHWFFGKNAGLDFIAGAPIVNNSGQTDANEGTASFSDEFGNLLFYTDGTNVFTRNHTIMPNGTGLNGHLSSTQSCIIIPAPGSANLYYIFTTDALERFLEIPLGSQSKGLNYSVVDMSIGVDGEITVKNIPLPVDGFQRCNEQLTAVAKADCSGYWVITSYLGKFYSFSVTSDGVNPDPVVSVGGPNSILPGAGYLRASHDGKKIAYTSITESGGLRVYDFNNENGVLSNENILFMLPRQYYGVEFSPNNTILYASTANNLLQYDLSATPANSEVILATNNANMMGALQLGPNNKIYYADVEQYTINEHLSVINDPDNFGNPGYVPDAISLGTKRVFGLPNFIPYLYHVKLFINNNDALTQACEGAPLAFSYCHVNRGNVSSTILWNFGDGSTTTDEAPEHIYMAAGTYTVTLNVTIGGRTYASAKQINVIATPVAQNAEQNICIPQGAAHTFNLSQSYPQINPGNENVTITFHPTEQKAKDNEDALPLDFSTTVSKTLWIRIENTLGCYTVRRMQLTVNSIPSFSTQYNVAICSGNTAVLQVIAQSSDIINWYDAQNSTTPLFTGNNYETPALTANASYWVETVSTAGCLSGRVKITVTVNSPSVSIQSAVTCSGNTATLLASSPSNTINWYDSAVAAVPVATGGQFTTPILTSDTSYWVEASTNTGCRSERMQVNITVNAVPALVVASADAICPGRTVLTATTTTGDTINWYASESAASPVATGIAFTTPELNSTTSYWVEAVSSLGCRSARVKVSVNVYPLPIVTISHANVGICEGTAVALDATSPGNIINWYDSAVATTQLYTGKTFTTPVLSGDIIYWAEAVSPQGCISSRVEVNVTVTSWKTPVFDILQKYCKDAQPELLPPVSVNGIRGNWSSPTISTDTPGMQSYIFTPDPGQCTSGPVVINIEVFESIIPEFNIETHYFFDKTPIFFPNLSNNGVQGIWSETASSGGSLFESKTYTFTPDPGQCAGDFSTTIKLIDYPRFFSPNGDGHHDLWNIWGFARENKASIIFSTVMEN